MIDEKILKVIWKNNKIYSYNHHSIIYLNNNKTIFICDEINYHNIIINKSSYFNYNKRKNCLILETKSADKTKNIIFHIDYIYYIYRIKLINSLLNN